MLAAARPRPPRAASALVATLALAALLGVSWRTPVQPLEAPAHEAIASAAEVVHAVAKRGPSGLVGASARASLGPAAGRGGVLVVLGAWSRESAGRYADPRVASRLPWLALAALGVTALFRLVGRRFGVVAGGAAAAALVATPQFHREAATASEAVAALSIWLLVLEAHVRSLARDAAAPGARARSAWTAAAWLGFGLAATFASAWALLVAWAHVLWARRSGSASRARRGELIGPALLLPALVVGPALALALTPAVWGAAPADVARWLTHDLGPEVAPGAQPPSGSASSLAAYLRGVGALPSLPLLVLAAAGLGVLARDALARRFASGALRPPSDPTALAALCVVGLTTTLALAAVTASPLAIYPPRVVTALPFLAACAGVAVGRAGRRWPSRR